MCGFQFTDQITSFPQLQFAWCLIPIEPFRCHVLILSDGPGSGDLTTNNTHYPQHNLKLLVPHEFAMARNYYRRVMIIISLHPPCYQSVQMDVPLRVKGLSCCREERWEGHPSPPGWATKQTVSVNRWCLVRQSGGVCSLFPFYSQHHTSHLHYNFPIFY